MMEPAEGHQGPWSPARAGAVACRAPRPLAAPRSASTPGSVAIPGPAMLGPAAAPGLGRASGAAVGAVRTRPACSWKGPASVEAEASGTAGPPALVMARQMPGRLREYLAAARRVLLAAGRQEAPPDSPRGLTRARLTHPGRGCRALRHGCRGAAPARPEDQTARPDDTASTPIRPRRRRKDRRARRSFSCSGNAKDPGDDLFSRGAAP